MIKRPDTAFSGPELCALPAREAVKLLHARQVSPAELVAASMTRLEQVEPVVNAVPTVCGSTALENASRSFSDALLGGLPVAIKDLMPTAGVRTTFGTLGHKDTIPQVSHPLVIRLENRGGIIMGKTNTPELGAGGHTFNDVFGLTRNPWNTARSAGGSSGGAAVSLATGSVWLSHGSDFAGSLRTPAHFCGVVGMRPSPGVAGGGPSLMGFTTGGAQGPMARDVLDCALFLDAMAGFDPVWPLSWPGPQQSYLYQTTRDPGSVRIAFSADLNGFAAVEPALADILRNTLARLHVPQITVEDTCPDLTTLDETFRILRGLAFVGEADATSSEITQHYKSTIRENIVYGRTLTLADYARAERNRSALYARMQTFFHDFEVLACPVAGLAAFPAELEYPRQVGGRDMHDYIEWLRFSYLATTLGLPALSIPVGFTDDGLPVGLQLIGKPRGDAQLLQIGYLLEQAMEFGAAPIDPQSFGTAGQ